MKIRRITTALLLLLAACQQQQVQTESGDTTEVQESSRTAETEIAPSTADDLSTFPHNWIGLTKRGNAYVIYKPCDADNAAIAIVQADGRDVVQYVWGQEASMYPITGFAQDTPDKSTITALTESEPQSPFTYTVEWIDSTQGIALWKWEWSRDGTTERYAEYFTPQKNAGNFATVMQPCTDCWSEAECAEMEKQQ